MKKAKTPADELRPEYKLSDFKGKGVRGKYLKSYRAGTNLTLLDTEVASVFPTDKAVNDALGSLMNVAKRSVSRRLSRTRKQPA